MKSLDNITPFLSLRLRYEKGEISKKDCLALFQGADNRTLLDLIESKNKDVDDDTRIAAVNQLAQRYDKVALQRAADIGGLFVAINAKNALEKIMK